MARVESFSEKLDSLFFIGEGMIENKGEDNHYCARTKYSAIVGVFDGCGGLGSRTYECFKGHTSAYMASRAVSGAIHDWYHKVYKVNWTSGKQLISSMRDYIDQALSVVSGQAEENFRIRGSMVRDFPTTAAIALAENQSEGIALHVIWAGDSRVYLMDDGGLAQLTDDDIEGQDAMSNLSNDGALTNVLSSDGKYELHYKCILIKKPTVIFAATDGCFGYVPTPMEFEHMILSALLEAANPDDFKKKLKADIKSYAGDDYALGMMTYGFGEFKNIQNTFQNRKRMLEQEYIIPLQNNRSNDLTIRLWKKYCQAYERYL